MQSISTSTGSTVHDWRHAVDGGNREFDVLVDVLVEGREIASQKPRTKTFNNLTNRKFAIAADMTKGKSRVAVKFQASPGNIAEGMFGVKALRAKRQLLCKWPESGFGPI